MKINKLNNRGFAHQLVILGAAVVLVIGGVFVVVLRANHNKKATAPAVAGSAAASSSGTSSTTQPAASATKSTSSSSSTTKTGATSSTSTSSPASTPAASSTTTTQKPIDVLTAIITNLKNGSASANVTTVSVDVPGPITTAKARPIVFTANGQTYFAYTQGSAPNFTTSAADTANTMAIVATSTNPATTTAHLDKSANLVDADFVIVGYSTGGN